MCQVCSELPCNLLVVPSAGPPDAHALWCVFLLISYWLWCSHEQSVVVLSHHSDSFFALCGHSRVGGPVTKRGSRVGYLPPLTVISAAFCRAVTITTVLPRLPIPRWHVRRWQKWEKRTVSRQRRETCKTPLWSRKRGSSENCGQLLCVVHFNLFRHIQSDSLLSVSENLGDAEKLVGFGRERAL